MPILLTCPDLSQKNSPVLVRRSRFSNRNRLGHCCRAALFVGMLAGGGSGFAQTWVSAVSASATANAAKVTWATAVPADSQVEYGTTASYGNVTTLAAAKVATHSVALSALAGGTSYHFRVRSSDASGVLVVGPDYVFTISIPVAISLSPQSATIAANGTQQFTATVSNDPNLAVSWTATAGTVNSSGLFMAPATSPAVPVTVTATSQADPTKTASAILQISAIQSAKTTLLGHPTVETLVNGLSDGVAEGYQITASLTGTVTTLNVYVDSATTAKNLFVGLYSDKNGHPGTLLTGGSSVTFQKTAWNAITVPPASITAGSTYWFALLGTGGLTRFRWKQGAGGWVDELNAVTTLTSLPATWTTGTIYGGGAWTSVYGSGLTGAGTSATPIMSVSPMSLSWAAQVGASALAPGSVSITNTGGGALTFTGVSDQPWLLISSANGTAPSALRISPSTVGLAAGTYTGHVTLSGSGATKTVTVVLSVTSPPPVQHTVSLSWKSTGAKAVSYSMYRSNMQSSSYGLLASAIGGTQYTDQSAQPGTTYYYVVTAVDNQGQESTYSNEIRVAVP